jgi:hypothetical protein
MSRSNIVRNMTRPPPQSDFMGVESETNVGTMSNHK